MCSRRGLPSRPDLWQIELCFLWRRPQTWRVPFKLCSRYVLSFFSTRQKLKSWKIFYFSNGKFTFKWISFGISTFVLQSNLVHYHLEVHANPKKMLQKNRLSLGIFFKFSLGPFEVVEVEWWSMLNFEAATSKFCNCSWNKPFQSSDLFDFAIFPFVLLTRV